MEKKHPISELKSSLGQAILEIRQFGRSSVSSVWIEMAELLEVCRFLNFESTPTFDQLEDFAVMELDQSLVLTYFLTSSSDPSSRLMLRGSLDVNQNPNSLTVPSLAGIWKVATFFEREAADLFGVRFQTQSQGQEEGRDSFRELMPRGWEGFPMRKNYVFPKSFFGIAHSRPLDVTPSRKGGS